MSISVELNQITKAFDTTVAVNDISLTIAPGELFFLLGPSGVWKIDVAPSNCRILYAGCWTVEV